MLSHNNPTDFETHDKTVTTSTTNKDMCQTYTSASVIFQTFNSNSPTTTTAK